MKFDLNKYIIVCDPQSNVDKTVKDLADNWCILSGEHKYIYFIATKKYWVASELRDHITKACSNVDCLVIGVFTTGSVASYGSEWTKTDTWNWFKRVCSDDVDKIRKNIKDEEAGLIPDSEINYTNKEEDLYL